jgi:putative restriction endonuclease
MQDRIFGHIPGVEEGQEFPDRTELRLSGVHRPLQHGISGSKFEGADSIVLSGGYEDDQDEGDVIIYTGHGGRDPDSGRQVGDQRLDEGNLALVVSCLNGLPVRVTRGHRHRSPDSPRTGYRYDGLYRVTDYWRERGQSGRIIWRFRLEKYHSAQSVPSKSSFQPQLLKPLLVHDVQTEYLPAPREETYIQRIIRNTEKARLIKGLYKGYCQVCGQRLELGGTWYAEAAHIRPLGEPHNGPDTTDNILCLCPNHHVLFDYGAFSIDDDYNLLGIEGRLILKAEHILNREHLHYHRNHYYRAV